MTVETTATIVVGSGPAGVAVAAGLARRGAEVLLVESGSDRERDSDREKHGGGDAGGVWGHEPLTENRRFVLGGTSTAWGGRCIPLDPIDFEARDWIPNSGWPISYSEFERWLPEAERLLEIPLGTFRRNTEDPLFASGPEIDGAPIEVWSPPTDVASRLPALEKSESVRIMRDTHVIGVDIDAGGTVTGIEAVTGEDRVRIVGARYVLAAGALENARLLLASPVAASLPALGRYYMSHVFATHMSYSGPPLSPQSDFFRIGKSYARHRWQLTPAAQRAHQVGNVIGFVARPPAHGLAMHLDPLSALVATAKLVRRHARHPEKLLGARSELLTYGRVLAKADISFWVHTLGQSLRRGRRHRLPMLLPPRTSPVQHLTVQAEHLPDPESRVLLSRDLDRFGVPLLAAHLDFGRTDFETVEVFHTALSRMLEPLGYRPSRSPAESTAALAADMYRSFNTNAHHIGTTRMGQDRATSVVDADARVHGVENLYVAGSSVFPTSGHANPTLSIVALAARLADHLASS